MSTYEDSYTVTADGKPVKISTDRKECEVFVDVQRRKLRGAGLAPRATENKEKSAAAAMMKWEIRETKDSDKLI